MPGISLSTLETRLLTRWNSNQYKNSANYLQRLDIGGHVALRGIKSASLRFNYPIVVLSGKNGAGKSTLLACALLAFHSQAEHLPKHQQAQRARSHYTFQDFFFQGPNDASFIGAAVKWSYSDGSTQVAVRSATRWLQYERRPHKGVIHLGVSRVVPASEQRAMRSHFTFTAKRRQHARLLTGKFLAAYTEILAKPYSEVGQLSSARYRLSVLRSGRNSYSSYNSGAGEDVVANLLYELQECVTGTFIAIEEIELGLHPEAQQRLMKWLEEFAWDKQLQIVVTTHSEKIIDSVPRIARVLVQKAGSSTILTMAPTTRFSLTDLAGHSHEELNIYCEDSFAAALIKSFLDDHIRRRVCVFAIGSASLLAVQAIAHHKARYNAKCMLIWDGDQRTKVADLRNAFRGEAATAASTSWTFLPSEFFPEEWAVRRLSRPPSREKLREQLDLDDVGVDALIQTLQSLASKKETPHRISVDFGVGIDEARRVLAKAAAASAPKTKDRLAAEIQAALDGQIVHEVLGDD